MMRGFISLVVVTILGLGSSEPVCDVPTENAENFLDKGHEFKVLDIGFRDNSVSAGLKDRPYLEQLGLIQSRIERDTRYVVTGAVGKGLTGKLLRFTQSAEPAVVSVDDILLKFLFQKSSKEKREVNTETEATYYNVCFAMGLRCPIAVRTYLFLFTY